MAIIGYARVSTTDQSLTIQTEKLTNHGCTEIFQDRFTGSTADRPKLKECMAYIRKGDSLVITKLDRLARSTFHLTQIGESLKTKGVDLIVLDQSINTETPTGRLLFNILGVIAEFESELRKERQMEGIAKAKANGVYFGAKKKLNDDDVAQLKKDREGGKLISDIGKKYRISRTTVYRLLNNS
jgi:DNA invertase Pin-like site-specific DNA recombinase